jgi:hypothetical protein
VPIVHPCPGGAAQTARPQARFFAVLPGWISEGFGGRRGSFSLALWNAGRDFPSSDFHALNP